MPRGVGLLGHCPPLGCDTMDDDGTPAPALRTNGWRNRRPFCHDCSQKSGKETKPHSGVCLPTAVLLCDLGGKLHCEPLPSSEDPFHQTQVSESNAGRWGSRCWGGEARPTGRSIRLEVPRHPRPGTPLMTFHKPRFDPGCQAACPRLGSLQECPPPPGSGAGRLCSAHPPLP